MSQQAISEFPPGLCIKTSLSAQPLIGHPRDGKWESPKSGVYFSQTAVICFAWESGLENWVYKERQRMRDTFIASTSQQEKVKKIE